MAAKISKVMGAQLVKALANGNREVVGAATNTERALITRGLVRHQELKTRVLDSRGHLVRSHGLVLTEDGAEAAEALRGPVAAPWAVKGVRARCLAGKGKIIDRFVHADGVERITFVPDGARHGDALPVDVRSPHLFILCVRCDTTGDDSLPHRETENGHLCGYCAAVTDDEESAMPETPETPAPAMSTYVERLAHLSEYRAVAEGVMDAGRLVEYVPAYDLMNHVRRAGGAAGMLATRAYWVNTNNGAAEVARMSTQEQARSYASAFKPLVDVVSGPHACTLVFGGGDNDSLTSYDVVALLPAPTAA